jgi:hypothetical protein
MYAGTINKAHNTAPIANPIPKNIMLNISPTKNAQQQLFIFSMQQHNLYTPNSYGLNKHISSKIAGANIIIRGRNIRITRFIQKTHT